MERVEARDATTFVISWQRPYPEAASFSPGEFEPLPRHLLEDGFRALEEDVAQQERFRSLPYWTQGYVGAGPYRLERWDPGAEFEGSAFSGHALGRPKIDRLLIRIIADENTTLSNLLAGNIDVGGAFTLRHEQAKVLRADWDVSHRGVVIYHTGAMNVTLVQFRPEFQRTPVLFDLRVRRALAHAIDRDALNEALFDGEGFMTETNITRNLRYAADVDRAIVHYPYDPRRTEQLMNDAGFAKDRDGFFASAAGERFRPDQMVEAGTLFERQLSLMTETWARAGIQIEPYLLPAVQLRDSQARATFPGLSNTSTGSGEPSLDMYALSQIGSPANRWNGTNRGAWSSPEFERLYEAYRTTLDRTARDQRVIDLMRYTSEQVPAYLLYFNIGVLAHLATLRGPAPGYLERWVLWNIHEWEFIS
jgi:peptide/nickel transport system substrate-binding protein